MDESAIFKIFHGLPRQGPGNNESTEKAFRSLPRLAPGSRILDIGCGVGMQTLHLADICEDCQITATDIYQPYLDDLMKKAAEKGVTGRISTVRASMDDLPFGEDSFDVIWSEGAIFVIGFEKGLSYWKRFLKEGGFIALTEAAWFTDTPSEEAFQFWQECYPAIRSIPEYEKAIEAAGYTLIGSFRLPAAAWWDDYYIPMEKRLDSIEEEYQGNMDAESIIEFSRREMEIFRKHSEEYGYAFFIMQKG
ncbi:class I SAM-dependent methyltransferase [Methanolobus chelungpuianus]|uniref:SAM-dependent methlyltransferase n=1 Tax=Methanolobus chelungpuianus TaxID=502115 RepID=A0AAE3HC04_9EURY|nr:class I SAM-dependent methyltransferase [Methanolobus chelungpuianus]MCQ6963447.1 SAM-dependent methlyltransferase [Methanolobus chelungpuianus]